MSIKKRVYLTLQKVIPQHFLSGCIFSLMHSDLRPFKNFLIKQFIKHFNVDLSTAVKNSPDDFIHFNDFFVRELTPQARPIDSSPTSLISPVDGCVSQIGKIHQERLFQAKGHHYFLSTLLAGDQAMTETFENGQFATLYLSPKDYHRIHMPVDGVLKKQIYVPGDLYAVNPITVENISGVFARNERTIFYFDTPNGPMVLIMVGAIFVGSMETVWQRALITPPYEKEIIREEFDTDSISLIKGEEMGRFNMGSTVILLFPDNQMTFSKNLMERSPVQMGQAIGEIII